MKYSFVIPSCNNGKWIGKCIDSILNQTYRNFEIIVVDDLSTDNSVEVIKNHLRKEDTLIINESKRLNGGTRNVGILKATGDYIFCIDCDDWLIDNKVLEDIDNKLNGEDLLFCGYLTHRIDSDISVNLFFKDIESAKRNITCAIWTKVVKASLLKSTLFPEGTLFEDRIHHYMLLEKVKTFTNLSREAVVWNRTNENTISGNMNSLWNSYRFNYIGDLFRFIQHIPDGDYREYLKSEINGYMFQIKEMVDKL